VRGGGRQAGSTHSAGSRQTYSSTLDGSHVHNSNSPAQHSTAHNIPKTTTTHRPKPERPTNTIQIKLNQIIFSYIPFLKVSSSLSPSLTQS